MSKISEAFKNGKAFIPFITCGYPNIETTEAIVREMVKNGADLIELGIPFSDPTAEGPVIEAASLRALENGTTSDSVFEMVQRLREDISIPLVFMTYANVVFSYGSERFISKCREVGIDGLILPDIPFEEKGEFSDFCEKYDVDLISLIAPTSDDRIEKIAKDAKGFIYIVSSLGVTGERKSIKTDIRAIIDKIKKNTAVPCAVGFGISTSEQAREMAEEADGVIVGSAVVKLAGEFGINSPSHIGEYVKVMKDAICGI